MEQTRGRCGLCDERLECVAEADFVFKIRVYDPCQPHDMSGPHKWNLEINVSIRRKILRTLWDSLAIGLAARVRYARDQILLMNMEADALMYQAGSTEVLSCLARQFPHFDFISSQYYTHLSIYDYFVANGIKKLARKHWRNLHP